MVFPILNSVSQIGRQPTDRSCVSGIAYQFVHEVLPLPMQVLMTSELVCSSSSQSIRWRRKRLRLVAEHETNGRTQEIYQEVKQALSVLGLLKTRGPMAKMI